MRIDHETFTNAPLNRTHFANIQLVVIDEVFILLAAALTAVDKAIRTLLERQKDVKGIELMHTKIAYVQPNKEGKPTYIVPEESNPIYIGINAQVVFTKATWSFGKPKIIFKKVASAAVRGILASSLKKKKEVDLTTICDLIAFVSFLGPIPRALANGIADIIEQLTVGKYVCPSTFPTHSMPTYLTTRHSAASYLWISTINHPASSRTWTTLNWMKSTSKSPLMLKNGSRFREYIQPAGR
ncbi:unnamed protein product [Caenorhabditis brenneri]